MGVDVWVVTQCKARGCCTRELCPLSHGLELLIVPLLAGCMARPVGFMCIGVLGNMWCFGGVHTSSGLCPVEIGRVHVQCCKWRFVL